MGASINLDSTPGGLDAGTQFNGSIDLSPGETMTFTGDLTHTDSFFSTSGDLGTYSFGDPGPGSFTSTNPSTGEFTFTMTYQEWVDAGSPANLSFAWSSTYDNTFGPASGSFDLSVTCFLAGSLIATPDGERAVETLQAGDLVLTADGRSVPVKWLGRQTVPTLLTASAKYEPVRIEKDALGQGVPHSDLTLTADHGMMVDGHVITAGALVNGTTIRFLSLEEVELDFTVYHVETEDHDVILANGAPAETFIDYVGRQGFDNYAEYLDLYGAERIIPEMPSPRISAQRLVPEATKARLGIAAVTGAEIDRLSA